MPSLTCKICNITLKSYQSLSGHITKRHNISVKNYYDLYLKYKNEEMCNHHKCVNKCKFANINYGYFKYCCRTCRNRSIEGRKISSDSSKSIWKDPNSSFNSNDRSEKLRKSFKNLWKDPNSIFRTKDYKKKKSESIKRLHADPHSGYNSTSYRKFRSKYMKNGGSSHCHRFIKNPSKPQITLFELCQTIFPYPILNYPCLNYSIDIAIPSINLAIEYDGSYWHQDKNYDKTRQKKLEKEGWKFLRYVDYVPTKQELLVNMNEVFNYV